jgi:hypothetical protein
MPSSWMLRRVALVRTDVSEERSASIIRVRRVGELHIVFLRSVCRLLVTANTIPSSSILVTLMIEVLRSSETSVLTRATWRNIPEVFTDTAMKTSNLTARKRFRNWMHSRPQVRTGRRLLCCVPYTELT